MLKQNFIRLLYLHIYARLQILFDFGLYGTDPVK